MAEGFGSIQRNKVNKDAGYKTLFEKITEKTNGESKSLSWYRKTVKEEANKLSKNFNKYVLDEKRDKASKIEKQDKNELRKYVVEGHLYMFEYKAKMKWLPYYDRFPLVYVIKSSKQEFWGVNLHYLPIKKRVIATKYLMNGKIDFPMACFHKYLHNHVDGLYIDLAADEWDTAILLPTEDFVKDINGSAFPVKKEDVWKDTQENFYNKLNARRVIKGYGTKESREMAK